MLEARVSARQSLIQEMSGSLVLSQEKIRLDVRNLSSNLLYAATIFNHDFIIVNFLVIIVKSFITELSDTKL